MILVFNKFRGMQTYNSEFWGSVWGSVDRHESAVPSGQGRVRHRRVTANKIGGNIPPEMMPPPEP